MPTAFNLTKKIRTAYLCDLFYEDCLLQQILKFASGLFTIVSHQKYVKCHLLKRYIAYVPYRHATNDNDASFWSGSMSKCRRQAIFYNLSDFNCFKHVRATSLSFSPHPHTYSHICLFIVYILYIYI